MSSDDERLRRYHDAVDRSLGQAMRPEMVAWHKAVTLAVEREWERAVASGHQITGIARGFIFRTGLDEIADSLGLSEEVRNAAWGLVISMLCGAADGDDDGEGPASKPKVKKPTGGETVDGG